MNAPLREPIIIKARGFTDLFHQLADRAEPASCLMSGLSADCQDNRNFRQEDSAAVSHVLAKAQAERESGEIDRNNKALAGLFDGMERDLQLLTNWAAGKPLTPNVPQKSRTTTRA